MRTLKRILLLLLLLLLAGGAYLWFNLASLAEGQIRAALLSKQIPVESLTVTGISTKRITLSDVALGEGGAVRAKSAELHFNYSWADRKLGAFDADLDGLELRAQLQDGQVLLGGIERAWSEALVTPNSKATAISLNGKATLSYQENGEISLNITDALLTLLQSQKNLVLPLQLNAQVVGGPDAYKLSGDFANARKQIEGTFHGDYAIASKTGTIKWDTKPMHFTPNGFTFAQLSPAFGEGIATISSRLQLSGTVALKPSSWSVTPKITVLELPVDTLLAGVLGEGTVVKGAVKGSVPIRVTKGGTWRIEKSRLINIGKMAVKVPPTAAAAQTLDANPQANLAKQALSNLQVDTLTLDVMSTDAKGGVRLDWHFIGRNPELLGGKPVDLTLAVTLNLQDMLNSLQEVKRATGEAERQLLKHGK